MSLSVRYFVTLNEAFFDGFLADRGFVEASAVVANGDDDVSAGNGRAENDFSGGGLTGGGALSGGFDAMVNAVADEVERAGRSWRSMTVLSSSVSPPSVTSSTSLPRSRAEVTNEAAVGAEAAPSGSMRMLRVLSRSLSARRSISSARNQLRDRHKRRRPGEASLHGDHFADDVDEVI